MACILYSTDNALRTTRQLRGCEFCCTDDAHVATAATSWHQQRWQLAEQVCHRSGRPTTCSCRLLSEQCHGRGACRVEV